jgi:crotonobetainyl-CoA:carnitine CoA-transferase CaiB-like acyl-CoA transferase
MIEQALSGVKVLDLTWHISGPFCTKIFGDFGAEVIKVEKPDQGDPARSIGPFLNDEVHLEKSLLFSHLNLNKKSITVDLKSDAGRASVLDLVKGSDILVESFSPGVMDRLGLDYETLKEIRPDLVMLSISNFGQSGPYRDFKVSELVLNGIGGDMYSAGIPLRHPLKLSGNSLQYQVGAMAAAAALTAYFVQQNQGIGQHLDISAQEVLAADTNHKSSNLLAWAYSGMGLTTSLLGRTDPREIESDIMPTGVYACKDGFVRVAGLLPFWDRFIKIFPELADQFVWPDDITDLDRKYEIDAFWYEWCAERTKNEIMEICQNVKYFGMAINTPLEAIDDPQFKSRGFWVEVDHPVTGKQIYPGDPLHAEASPWKVRMPAPLLGQHNEEILSQKSVITVEESAEPTKTGSKSPKLPLEGIRVVDMGVIWAGPTTAWLMGCLGAEVIHIDNPHHIPDMSRGFTIWPNESMLDRPGAGASLPGGKVGRHLWNQSAFYNRALWNRRSCCIDIDQPEGKEVFKKLIAKSDIFVENNGASAMEHLGLDHEVLMQVNPGLICINMPAWGRSGPYKDFVGWGAMHQAVSGEEWLRGYDDSEHPFHNTFRYHMDSASPPMAVFGAIMGLMQRQKTGKGQWIDFAQMQALTHHLGEIYMDAAWNGRNQRTIGNRHPTAIQGCYSCRGNEPDEDTSLKGGERWLNITLNDETEWQAFCRVLGNPQWTKDEKFATHDLRYQHHDELDKHIEAWTQTRDNFEAFYVLQGSGIPAGPVEDWRDAHMDPQLNMRGFFRTMFQEDVGTYRYPGFPWQFPETPLEVTHAPCTVGEDNEYVYKEVIGFSDDEIAELESQGVIGDLKYPTQEPIPEHIVKQFPDDS